MLIRTLANARSLISLKWEKEQILRFVKNVQTWFFCVCMRKRFHLHISAVVFLVQFHLVIQAGCNWIHECRIIIPTFSDRNHTCLFLNKQKSNLFTKYQCWQFLNLQFKILQTCDAYFFYWFFLRISYIFLYFGIWT